jgi:uracil-DNA glycosylase
MKRDPASEPWQPSTTAQLPGEWRRLADEFWQSSPGDGLRRFLEVESRQHAIFPRASRVFRALQLTPLDQVQAVILGQDPYHGDGQADGLAFSVPAAVPTPPSLRNILQELGSDLQVDPPRWLDLQAWATAGVLLLNTTLTVRRDHAGSHRGRGWETLTDQVIRTISGSRPGVVFVLWGRDAQKKRHLVDHDRHLVLASAHPSPLSAYRGFFGSRPFSATNRYLEQQGRQPIRWLS